MRLLLATDAWRPQNNGVVTTLSRTTETLWRWGWAVQTITPDLFPGLACPWYPEIRLCLPDVEDVIENFSPEHIHIATEGPIGLAVRQYCQMRSLRFTTSYHTDFPAYLQAYMGVPREVTYGFLRWFHGGAQQVMVATQAVQADLAAHGFKRMVRWSRGVDVELFRPLEVDRPRDGDGPLMVYLGRVAREKNIEAFLDLKVGGAGARKRVIGGGPMLEEYRRRYPGVEFTGAMLQVAAAGLVAEGDVFVFPSKTDTFGLVVLEALACGVPVAAYPQPGPLEVINSPALGAVDEDLERAAERALAGGDREACRRRALEFSWERCTRQFAGNLMHTRVLAAAG